MCVATISHTFARIHIHVIFSTKERKNLIPKDIQPQLWSYMAGICHNQGMAPIAINGTGNHVHALIHLPTTMAVAKAVNLLKANSSRWMSERGKKFAWQDGYGAFSVSQSNTQAVINYIRDQEKHHRKRSYEDELLALLKGIASNSIRNMSLDDELRYAAPLGLRLFPYPLPTRYQVGSVITPLRGWLIVTHTLSH